MAWFYNIISKRKMKRNFLKPILKPAVVIVLVSMAFSSCSVTYRERRRRPPPPPQEKVIIRP